MGKVSVTRSRTINLGNYESAKIEVGLELESDDVDTAYVEALSFVDARIAEELGTGKK